MKQRRCKKRTTKSAGMGKPTTVAVWDIVGSGPLPDDAIEVLAELVRDIAKKRLQRTGIDTNGQIM